eukprot:273863-Alexandrium_andersonii.AAC.1
MADCWGGEACAATAWGHSAKSESRIDFIFCTPPALQFVQGFAVGPPGVFDVHRVLTVQLRSGQASPSKQLRPLSPRVPAMA